MKISPGKNVCALILIIDYTMPAFSYTWCFWGLFLWSFDSSYTANARFLSSEVVL